jgi:hypothetical protein
VDVGRGRGDIYVKLRRRKKKLISLFCVQIKHYLVIYKGGNAISRAAGKENLVGNFLFSNLVRFVTVRAQIITNQAVSQKARASRLASRALVYLFTFTN